MARQATASRTQEERTEEAKARLRDAALELFAADGYDATTLAAISLHAGFSRTLAQYHYPDKGALALELLEERILRDNHLELLDCPPDASAQQAWAALQKHLSEVTEYYGALHGGAQKSAKLRGEMAIHAAALMGSDEAISARVALLTRELIAAKERLLEICRKQGMISVDADVHALAVLQVHSIWGLALALFANPKGGRQIKAALAQIGAMLEALRVKNQG
ncbi:MAG: TetR/AcrR family transcriptional regulator [Novosphingobium sp.]|nr:TetR/AcrR family transcriptional regulator [Novosphingobium sp.]